MATVFNHDVQIEKLMISFVWNSFENKSNIWSLSVSFPRCCYKKTC